MKPGDMLNIRVPASTANLGPGFDSIGMALNLYLDMEVELANEWEMVLASEELRQFPTDESNFTIQIALKTAKKMGKTLPPCRIKMESDIPLARGLGSSAAAIIAGIELADVVGELHLSKKEKLQIATEIEGHPDNVGASLYGGLFIGAYANGEVDAISIPDVPVEFVAVVPKEELLTKDSRNVLPEHFSFPDAVKAGAIGNVLVAALIQGDFSLAGKMMKKDMFHQPYRKKLVPHIDLVDELATSFGALGVALSGAGPTILCLCKQGEGERLEKELKEYAPQFDYFALKVDREGARRLKTVCNK